jgi:hypothetical protein
MAVEAAASFAWWDRYPNAGIQIVHPVEESQSSPRKKMLAIHPMAFLTLTKAHQAHVRTRPWRQRDLLGSVHSKEASVMKCPPRHRQSAPRRVG